MGLQFFSCYFQIPLTGVAKKLRYVRLNRWIHNLRTRFGHKIIYKKGALPHLTQTLRLGEVVGLLIDMSRSFDGVEVRFLGRKATATPAAALLAIRCKSAVLPMYCLREADGIYMVHVEAPLEVKRTNDLRADLQINTQAMTDILENAVRQNPEQWFWFQRRWKDFYPDLYPEHHKRWQQRKLKKEKGRRKKSRISRTT